MADLMILESLPFILSLSRSLRHPAHPPPPPMSLHTHAHTRRRRRLPPRTLTVSQSADGLSLVFMISSQAQLHIITVNSALSLKLKKIRLFVKEMYAAPLLLGLIAAH